MAKKSTFAVIGIGKFGTSVCLELESLGHDVLAIDSDHSVINKIGALVEHSVILDSTNEEALKEIGIESVDHVVVAIGEDERASILTVLILIELGVKDITVKAQNEYHAKVLEKIGANNIILPEKETGRRLARKISSKNMFDYIELASDYSLAECKTPTIFVGKTLINADVRKKYNVHIIAVKRGEKVEMLPPTEPMLKDDILLVIGDNKSLNKFDSL